MNVSAMMGRLASGARPGLLARLKCARKAGEASNITMIPIRMPMLKK